MQQAKDLTQELLNEIEPSEKVKQDHMDRLKPEINSLLHEFLPDDTTIKEAGILREELQNLRVAMTHSSEHIDWANKNFGTDFKKASDN